MANVALAMLKRQLMDLMKDDVKELKEATVKKDNVGTMIEQEVRKQTTLQGTLPSTQSTQPMSTVVVGGLKGMGALEAAEKWVRETLGKSKLPEPDTVAKPPVDVLVAETLTPRLLRLLP